MIHGRAASAARSLSLCAGHGAKRRDRRLPASGTSTGRRDGGKTYAYALLDDATRMVPFAGFYGAENATCFQEAFKQGSLRRERFGPPPTLPPDACRAPSDNP